MAIVFLVPHILLTVSNYLLSPTPTNCIGSVKSTVQTYLVIPHLTLLIKRQRNQTINLLGNRHRLRRILLLQLEDNLIGFG